MTCTRCGHPTAHLPRCRGPVVIRPARDYAPLAVGPASRVAGERRPVVDGAGCVSAYTDGALVYGREVTSYGEREHAEVA